jgi:hypothetical protein
MRARNSTTSGDRLLTMRPALFLAVVDGSRSVAQNLGSHPYQGSARGLVSTGSQLRPAQRCTAGDRCEPLGSDGVWTKRGPGMPACGGSGAPRRGPRLARETPAGCPRQASPAWAIALLGGALAGSGPGTSPCIDGLSLVTGMVVPSTLRVQTTRTMVSAWAIWHHEPDRLRLGGRIRTRFHPAASAEVLGAKVLPPAGSSYPSCPLVPAGDQRFPRRRGPNADRSWAVGGTMGIRDMTSPIRLDSGTTVVPAAGPGDTFSRGCGR